ncbi:MAG: hypothetical protein DRP66_04930 [Planctomycetota bacterium]|nr:MAG: hypothetical protein DRP66_04930 [Planctomycetota bacterium]
MKKFTLLVAAIVLLQSEASLQVGIVGAGPLVDGKFDLSEGYTDGFRLDLAVVSGRNSTVTADDGRLWLYQDLDDNLYVNLTLPLTLVDNTYGRNSVGWGKGVAPSGKNHNFKDLKDSDDAQFRFYNGDGDLVLDFVLDYLTSSDSTSSGYAAGVDVGQDSKGHKGKRGRKGESEFGVGSVEDILEVGTSLDYNFNTLGHVLTEDSPATDEDYVENSEYAGWLFEVSYEFKIDGDVFGDKGFGDIRIPLIHVSPNKIARNKVFNYDREPTPEPSTICLLGIGALSFIRRKVKMPMKCGFRFL